MKPVEVLFAPAEFAALAGRDLKNTTGVVFDVLRATSTMVTALANGAAAVRPVEDIAEALAWRQQQPEVLLAGERGGLRITAEQTGGVDFDLGNSPREFTPEVVEGKTIVATTTNGTRALKACAGARVLLVGAFLNLTSTAHAILSQPADELLLVCSGTGDEAAFEDTLAAGALADLLEAKGFPLADSAQISREVYLRLVGNLSGAMVLSRNGARLLAHPELQEDVALCLRRDVYDLVAGLEGDGCVRRAVVSHSAGIATGV